jgi:hypothetical protein
MVEEKHEESRSYSHTHRGKWELKQEEQEGRGTGRWGRRRESVLRLLAHRRQILNSAQPLHSSGGRSNEGKHIGIFMEVKQ